ncbi:MAG: glycosyltransferase family 4 protein [Spirochaetes bacterium]|nr:glycosyltransferase family 4 protein [Spirochaetota bacterium]
MKLTGKDPTPMRTLLLVSGTPLKKKTSFKRQLALLGRVLAEGGTNTLLSGPGLGETSGVVGNICGAILLGYPDQFGFLYDDTAYPLFFWAQLSRLVDPESFGNALAVPLTRMSKRFLEESKIENIGPVIPHGVDTAVYVPLKRGEKAAVRKRYGIGDGFVVGTVAANTRRKRLDLVIEAFAGFFGRAHESELLIKTDRKVGLDGTDLGEIAAAHGVRRRVKIIEGSFDERRMAGIYNCMDLYLTLSEWEGFCIPVIEAMACGVPVATHRVQGPGELVPYDDLIVPGSRESIDDGAKLLEADPSAAALVLLSAYDDGTRLKRLKKEGRTEAVKAYDIRVVAELWTKLLSVEA